MFLPRGIHFSVVCDFDDPEERLVRVAACDGNSVASLTAQRTLTAWAELGRKLECYEPSEEKVPLLKNNWKVEPPDGAKYAREERLTLVREYANKVVFQIDVVKKFSGDFALRDGAGLGMRPEQLKDLGARIVAWAIAGAEAPLACYLVDDAWREAY